MQTTGQKCETSGIYRGDCPAEATHKREIALSHGDTFPPCAQCSRAVTWTLVRATV